MDLDNGKDIRAKTWDFTVCILTRKLHLLFH